MDSSVQASHTPTHPHTHTHMTYTHHTYEYIYTPTHPQTYDLHTPHIRIHIHTHTPTDIWPTHTTHTNTLHPHTPTQDQDKTYEHTHHTHSNATHTHIPTLTLLPTVHYGCWHCQLNHPSLLKVICSLLIRKRRYHTRQMASKIMWLCVGGWYCLVQKGISALAKQHIYPKIFYWSHLALRGQHVCGRDSGTMIKIKARCVVSWP